MELLKHIYDLVRDELDHLFWKYKEGITIGAIILLLFLISFAFSGGTSKETSWDSEYQQMRAEENYNL